MGARVPGEEMLIAQVPEELRAALGASSIHASSPSVPPLNGLPELPLRSQLLGVRTAATFETAGRRRTTFGRPSVLQ